MSKLIRIVLPFAVVFGGAIAAQAVNDGITVIKEGSVTECTDGGECNVCQPGEFEYVYMMAIGDDSETVVSLSVPVAAADVIEAGFFDGPGIGDPEDPPTIAGGFVTWSYPGGLTPGDTTEAMFICSGQSGTVGLTLLTGVTGTVVEIECPVPGGNGDPVCEEDSDSSSDSDSSGSSGKSGSKSDSDSDSKSGHSGSKSDSDSDSKSGKSGKSGHSGSSGDSGKSGSKSDSDSDSKSGKSGSKSDSDSDSKSGKSGSDSNSKAKW